MANSKKRDDRTVNGKQPSAKMGNSKTAPRENTFIRLINDKRLMIPIMVLTAICVVSLCVLLVLDASGLLYGFNVWKDDNKPDEGSNNTPELLDGVKHKSGNYEYRILKDGTAELYYYDNPQNRYETELVVPSEIDGYRVSMIGSECYVWMASLTKVTIPDGITEIGFEAFNGCGNLIYVRIPESIERIGRDAFKNCPASMKVEYSGDIEKVEIADGNSALVSSLQK